MTTKISIYQDGVFAGSGDFINGSIANCAAQFCDDNDESMEVYETIDEAIGCHETEVGFTFSDGSKRTYTWDLLSEPAEIPDDVYFLHPE